MIKYIKSSYEYNPEEYGVFDETGFVLWMYDNYNDFEYIGDFDVDLATFLKFSVGSNLDQLLKELARLEKQYGIRYHVYNNSLFVSFDGAWSVISDEINYFMLNTVRESSILDYPDTMQTGEDAYQVINYDKSADVEFETHDTKGKDRYVCYINGNGPYTHSDLNEIIYDIADNMK